MLLMPSPNSPLARLRQQELHNSNNSSNSDSDPSVSAVAPTTLEERLELVSKRFLHDVCNWMAFDDGRPLEPEEVRRAATLYMAPAAVIHVDGLLGFLLPPTVTGQDALFDYLERERAAYRPVGLETLLVAVNAEQDTVFVLSRFRVESVGPWLGRQPTGRISAGVRIDELRFDSEAKVVEAWCNRQLYEEEREALLRDPGHHHAASLEPSLLRTEVPEHEDGSHGPLAPHKMLRVAAMWAESWNVATASGSLNPDLLDNLLEEDFAVHDLLGLTGDDPEHMDHPYTAVKSLSDAKRVLTAVTDRYDVDETVVRMAARKGSNAVFSHWRARLETRTPEAVAAREGAAADPFAVGPGPVVSSTGSSAQAAAAPPQQQQQQQQPAPASSSFVAEAAELLLFAPSGKLQAALQFRRPLGSDRRKVLLVLAPPPADPGEAVEGA